MAFGGETIDNLGVIRDFPAASMLTGLIANALGWRSNDAEAHDRLQARIIFGARIDRCGSRMTDFQTADLYKDDSGWTTTGKPEGRAGGDGTYKGQHLRYREHQADASVLVVLRLEPCDESPTLDQIADALQRPLRPLFLGRKPCLPATPLHAGWYEAPNILGALHVAMRSKQGMASDCRAMWPEGEGDLAGSHRFDLCDERNWTSGAHGGWRPLREGTITVVTRP